MASATPYVGWRDRPAKLHAPGCRQTSPRGRRVHTPCECASDDEVERHAAITAILIPSESAAKSAPRARRSACGETKPSAAVERVAGKRQVWERHFPSESRLEFRAWKMAGYF